MFNNVARSTPPRFATRTLIATLATVAFVLTAVLVVVTLIVRDHVRRSVIEKLETGQRLFAATQPSAVVAPEPFFHDAVDAL